MSDYVFQNASTPEGDLWRELERSYELRARLLERTDGLDAISETLVQGLVFELQEIELAHGGSDPLEVEDDEALERVRALNAQLQGWLERLGD